jgi:hypothetical protein
MRKGDPVHAAGKRNDDWVPAHAALESSGSRSGALAVAGGAAFAALAALEVTYPHIRAVAVKTPAEHAILALFAAGLLLIAPAFFTLAQYGSRLAPAQAAAAGHVCSRSARRTRTSAAATPVGSILSPKSPTFCDWAARSGSASTSTATPLTSESQSPAGGDAAHKSDRSRQHTARAPSRAKGEAARYRARAVRARGGLRATRPFDPRGLRWLAGRRAWFGHCSLFTLIAMVSSGPSRSCHDGRWKQAHTSRGSPYSWSPGIAARGSRASPRRHTPP